MSAKRTYRIGFLSIVAATGVFAASNCFATDAQRVDVIETLHEHAAQLDSIKTGNEVTRVDVIDSIGSGGPLYPYTKSTRVDVIDRLGDRRTGYAYTKSMSH